MKVVAIIQARLASERLPGKVLYCLGGYPVLYHIVKRVQQAKCVDRVVVATTLMPEDEAIVDVARAAGAETYCGSENDVLLRYHRAAGLFNAEIIVRITADCPFIDPRWIDYVVTPLLDAPFGLEAYSSNVTVRRLPDGLDVEAFTWAALGVAQRETPPDDPDREHVTERMIRTLPDCFGATPKESLAHLRWTLDTPKDYAKLCAMVSGLDCEPPLPTTAQLLEVQDV